MAELFETWRRKPASPGRNGHPQSGAYDGQQDLLYLNSGDGTFRDVSATAGIIQEEPGHGFAAVFSDYDDDGDQDLYVANDSGPNFYYANNGAGTFEDISWESGAMVNEHGEPEGSMGLTVGDYNNDARLDIFITNFIEQSNTLYENDGDNMFLDQTTSLGLDPVGFNYSGWGTKFIDFDNDGRLDLFITNGHTDERLGLPSPIAQDHKKAVPAEGPCFPWPCQNVAKKTSGRTEPLK